MCLCLLLLTSVCMMRKQTINAFIVNADLICYQDVDVICDNTLLLLSVLFYPQTTFDDTGMLKVITCSC